MKPEKNNSTDLSLRSRIKLSVSALFAVLIAFSAVVLAFAEGEFQLRVDSVGSRSVSLSWDKVDGADGYKLYFVDGEDYKTIKSVEGTSFTVEKLSPKTTYSFMVRAFTLIEGVTDFAEKSEIVSAKTTELSGPSPSVEYVRPTRVKLTWDRNDDADGYMVYSSADGENFRKLGDIERNACIVQKLRQATKYFFKVRPYYLDENGEKVFGSFGKALAVKTGRIAVSGFAVTKTSADSISFRWDRADEADGYKIYRVQGEKLRKVASTGETSFTLKNQKPNEKSRFLVLAFSLDREDKASYGQKSETVTALTLLSKPGNFKQTAAGADAVRLKWEKVAGAKSYNVFLRDETTKKYVKVKTVEKTAARIEGLAPGEKRFIKISAAGDENRSEKSASFALYTKPGKVEGVRVSGKTSTTLTLSWKKSAGFVTYDVYASKTSGNWKKQGVVSKAKFSFKNADAATTYFFKVVPLVERNGLVIKGEGAVAKGKTKKLSLVLEGSTSARKGEYFNLSAKGTGVTKSNVVWTTSNPNVVSVKNGKLLASGVGSCTVTAKCGGQAVSKKLSVSSPVLGYMAAVYDVTNGDYIFQSRLTSRAYPGSITKLITALVAVKYCRSDTVFTVGSELNMIESNASRAGISAGERFTLEQLLYGLLVPSGCDCAYTIAVNVARRVSGNNSMTNRAAANYFASLMNSYMSSIGCTGSHMVNPHGYPNSNHYTTTGDMILVAKKVLETPLLKKITSTTYKYVTALTGRGRGWSTTNGLMRSSSAFYCPYTHGMKTGTVNDGYANIISVATKGGRTIITAVFGTESYNARYNATWKMYNAYLY